MDDAELRSRFDEIERRMAGLTERIWRLETNRPRPVERAETGPGRAAAPVPPSLEPLAPMPPQPTEVPLPVRAPAFAETAPAAPPQRSSEEWEALLGGNWLNKLGVFLLVIGIALALGYSFTRVGPWGRVSIALAASVAMLAGGVVLDERERYRIFARGLLGGGWAALYFTVYAMQAVEAAKVIDSPLLGGILLLAVALGMIAHSLRYRSQTVTGLAYLIAFATLAITEVTALSVIALVPLAASLLFVARRFEWSQMALVGAVATWATCASRGDTGAPLWEAQAIFAVYWLLFEGFDILLPQSALVPLNALGFLALSIVKWHHAAPGAEWQLLAASAAAYAASAWLRGSRHPEVKALAGGWEIPAALTAALWAAALFGPLEHQQLLIALALEAEIFFLAGIWLRRPFLRYLAAPLFALEALHLWLIEAPDLPKERWIAAAAVSAVLFYANRALRSADIFYGYAAAAMVAMMAGSEAGGSYRGAAWLAVACVPFLLGWWRRLPDFRYQGYALAALGALATALTSPHQWTTLTFAAALGYGLFACTLSEDGCMTDTERGAVRQAASFCGTAFASAALWRALPESALAPAWAWFALALVFAGRDARLSALRWQGALLAGLSFLCCWGVNLAVPLEPVAAGALAIVAYYGAQLLSPRAGRARLYYSLLGSSLAAILLAYRVSGSLLTVAWGGEGLVLLISGFPLRDRVLRLSGLALLMACILKLFLWDLRHLDTLPRIFSFIVLGLILVGVSWIYTRFRERVQRYL